MTRVAYKNTSPYFTTQRFSNFLDVMVDRPITKYDDDVLYAIDKVYEFRPDMLANDMYGNSSLWWVFAQRNPNVLKDPLFDFRAGTEIYIPRLTTLNRDLGI